VQGGSKLAIGCFSTLNPLKNSDVILSEETQTAGKVGSVLSLRVAPVPLPVFGSGTSFSRPL